MVKNREDLKERVSITMTSKLLKLVDEKVNENPLIYNRSIVIESILTGKLNPITLEETKAKKQVKKTVTKKVVKKTTKKVSKKK